MSVFAGLAIALSQSLEIVGLCCYHPSWTILLVLIILRSSGIVWNQIILEISYKFNFVLKLIYL